MLFFFELLICILGYAYGFGKQKLVLYAHNGLSAMAARGPGFALYSFPHPLHEPQSRPAPGAVVVNDDLHCIHTLKGSAYIRVGAVKWTMSVDEVIFIPPFRPYEITLKSAEPLEMINFHFRLFGRQGIPIENNTICPLRFTPKGLKRIHQQLRQWQTQWQSGQDDLHHVVHSLHGLAIRYFEAFGMPGSVEQDSDMLRVRAHLETSVEKTYHAESIADSAYLSVSQLNRRFRSAFGISPKAYWQQIRVGRIQTMLRRSDLSIGQLARYWGFKDTAYFSRWFREQTGFTPRAWRQQIEV